MSSLKRGHCLSSQSIRERILRGSSKTPAAALAIAGNRFSDKTLEDRIQPASRDTVTGEDLYIIDTEDKGLFKPTSTQTVKQALLQLPLRQRPKFNIHNGFEIQSGYTYLLRLEDQERVSANETIKSSPKSSYGRLFLNSRMLADFNPCFDQINPYYRPDTPLDLWLLIQPLAFNGIIYPGLSLSQLRFFEGDDAKLNARELRTQYEQEPILYMKGANGLLVPAPFILTVNGGLQLHLDAEGKDTFGVIGLRARKNPHAIDFRARGKYPAEDYFEPLILGKFRSIKPREPYLMASSEVFKTPSHLSIELESASEIGFTGLIDFAGFIDNGFSRDLVYEIISAESTNIEVTHNKPIGSAEVFWTDQVPDKLYGAGIGSTYHNQVGPQPSKHFLGFDYKDAARKYEKLNRKVLVQDADLLRQHRKAPYGFELLDNATAGALEQTIHEGFFHYRYDCEFDELVLQPIPYVVVFGSDAQVFMYTRARDKSVYGDSRLFGKLSVCVGGHINEEDAPDYLSRNIERVTANEIEVEGKLSAPRLIGTLMADDLSVDRVHFGLIYVSYTNGSVRVKDPALPSGGMRQISHLLQIVNGRTLQTDPEAPGETAELETWSRILIPHLPQLYRL